MYLSVLILLAPTNVPPKPEVGMIANIYLDRILRAPMTHGIIGMCPPWNNSMESPNWSVPHALHLTWIFAVMERITPMKKNNHKTGELLHFFHMQVKYCILVTLNWSDLMDGNFEIKFADTNANLLGWESLRPLTSYRIIHIIVHIILYTLSTDYIFL